MLCSARQQLNRLYAHPLSWDNDRDCSAAVEQDGFVCLFVVMAITLAMGARQAFDVLAGFACSFADVTVRVLRFFADGYADIVNTCNGRDKSVKSTVFGLQCVMVVAAVYLAVFISVTPAMRFGCSVASTVAQTFSSMALSRC